MTVFVYVLLNISEMEFTKTVVINTYVSHKHTYIRIHTYAFFLEGVGKASKGNFSQWVAQSLEYRSEK